MSWSWNTWFPKCERKTGSVLGGGSFTRSCDCCCQTENLLVDQYHYIIITTHDKQRGQGSEPADIVSLPPSFPVSRKPLPPLPEEELQNKRVTTETTQAKFRIKYIHHCQKRHSFNILPPHLETSSSSSSWCGERWGGWRGSCGGALWLPWHRVTWPESRQRRRICHPGEVRRQLVQGTQPVWVSPYWTHAKQPIRMLIHTAHIVMRSND